MKNILALSLCLLLLFSLNACDAKEDVTYHITKRHLEHQTGDINLTEYTYDDQWLIQSTQTLLNGDFASSVEYTYSEDMSVVTMTTISAIYDSSVSEIHQTYDESGNLLSAASYSEGRLSGTTSYTYDAEGRQIKAVTTYPDSSFTTTLEHVYDAAGNLIAYTVDTGLYTSRQEHTYDSRNRRISTAAYQNDALTNRIEYTWEGNTQLGTIYNADDIPLRETVTIYDNAWNALVEETYDILGTLESRTCCEYVGTDGSISSGIPE